MNKTLFLLFFVFTFSCESQNSSKDLIADSSPVIRKTNDTQLPIQPKDSIAQIGELRDIQLQTILENEINKNESWKVLVANNAMAVGIVDLTNIENIKYAGINDNNMMYAASLPKIAVLLASMDAIDKGELEDTPEIRDDMKQMISKSNNQATTRMIDRVGYAKIEEVVRSPRNAFYDEATGGGLWVGKRYGGGGDTNREPLKNLSHAATTKQVCSFYYQLAMGNLISDERSKEMLEIMKDPALHHKFVNTLDQIAPQADIYRKSGSWRSYHSDSALVWGPKRRYIIVALVDNDYGETIIRDLVKPLEKVMKKARTLDKQQKM
ncbi:beta-lactamase class A [Winogradskyella epiphytica]|uniref:Beta-lactamase class A n=1 Tax=Winogradskyella epiphytica TaxID=262005 RepID=A0A2V4XD59_9FLAO|nr:serine hydrolase [Winogradskyella epiphytica]PYE80299.1 beta-lactamase class A [Winogradskyella epiphytica]